MEEDEKPIDTLEAFTKKIIEEQKDLDPDIAQIVNEHFWELL